MVRPGPLTNHNSLVAADDGGGSGGAGRVGRGGSGEAGRAVGALARRRDRERPGDHGERGEHEPLADEGPPPDLTETHPVPGALDHRSTVATKAHGVRGPAFTPTSRAASRAGSPAAAGSSAR